MVFDVSLKHMHIFPIGRVNGSDDGKTDSVMVVQDYKIDIGHLPVRANLQVHSIFSISYVYLESKQQASRRLFSV